MAARAAENIAGLEPGTDSGDGGAAANGPSYAGGIDAVRLVALQEIMSAHVGVVRSAESLGTALDFIERLGAGAAPSSPLANMAETARLMTVCALAREESRGGHYRSDFPELAGAARRSFVTLSAAQVLSARALGY